MPGARRRRISTYQQYQRNVCRVTFLNCSCYLVPSVVITTAIDGIGCEDFPQEETCRLFRSRLLPFAYWSA